MSETLKGYGIPPVLWKLTHGDKVEWIAAYSLRDALHRAADLTAGEVFMIDGGYHLALACMGVVSVVEEEAARLGRDTGAGHE